MEGVVAYALCQRAESQGETLHPFLIMTLDDEPDSLSPLS